MKLEELKQHLNKPYFDKKGDLDVVVALDDQSIGGTACVTMSNQIRMGDDWDKGKLFLVPDEPIVRKVTKWADLSKSNILKLLTSLLLEKNISVNEFADELNLKRDKFNDIIQGRVSDVDELVLRIYLEYAIRTPKRRKKPTRKK